MSFDYLNKSGLQRLLNNLKSVFDTKQDKITSTNKLSYSLISGTPTIPTVPSSLPANGGNADTVDNKHASDFATASHTHDDRYYTETEINNKLDTKFDKSGGTVDGELYVDGSATLSSLVVQGGARFVNTIQGTVEKANKDGSGNVITSTYATKTELGGKANSSHTHTKSDITDFSHTHDDRYYTESEMDTKLGNKQDKITSSNKLAYSLISGTPTIPTTLPANGGNSDTVDGKHASYFASATDVADINNELNTDYTDDTVARVKTIPSGACTYGTIDVLSGMSRKGKNLFVPTLESTTKNGITCTKNADNTYTLSGTASAETSFTLGTSKINNGLKVCGGINASCFLEYVEWDSSWATTGITSDKGSGFIANNQANSVSFRLQIRVVNGTVCNNLVVKPMVSTDTSATYNDYEPYTENLIDAKVDKVVSVGKNLFDINSEAESVGHYYNASKELQNSNTLSIWKIKLQKNTDYTISGINYTTNNAHQWGLINGELSVDLGTLQNHTFNSGNCDEMYLTLRNNETSQMLEIGSSATSYAPYKAPIEKTIPQSIKSLDGYGIGINSMCYNYIDFDRKVFVKKVGSVDLGSLSYTKYAQQGMDSTYYTQLDSIVSYSGTEVANIICAKYETTSYYAWNRYGQIVSNTKWLQISDNNYSDATTFKNAMNGQILYYELATPTETDISSMLDTDADILTVEENGTLSFHYPSLDDGYSVDMPSTVTYMALKSSVDKLYDVTSGLNDNKANKSHKHTKSDITDFPTSMTPTAHNQASNTINAMIGYSKPSSTSAIGTSDTLNSAIGKLEKALDGKGTSSFSGNYNDLTNKPTIPTVNNATLTIQKNGTNVQTFTANQNTNATANIIVPTKVSELTNDSGYLTSHQSLSGYATQTWVNSQGFKTTDNNTTYTFATGDSNGQIKVTPSGGTTQNVSVKGLGSLAYSSATIPSKTSQLTNDSGFVTTDTKNASSLTCDSYVYGSGSATTSVQTALYNLSNATKPLVVDIQFSANDQTLGVSGSMPVGGTSSKYPTTDNAIIDVYASKFGVNISNIEYTSDNGTSYGLTITLAEPTTEVMTVRVIIKDSSNWS